MATGVISATIYVSQRIQIYPKQGISQNQSYDLGMELRSSILLDWEGSWFLGYHVNIVFLNITNSSYKVGPKTSCK